MALTQVDQGLLSSTAQYTGFKNRILNGAMVIDQRNAGASVTYDGSSGYSIDRYFSAEIGNGAFTVQQVSDAPAGFTKSFKVTVTTAQTGTLNAATIQQIEGFNTADFAWGTASASPVTISFWVKSSVTGTLGGVLQNSAATRSYPFVYTVSSANTWEQKSITIAGDTSGTWLTDNGVGISLRFTHGTSTTGTAGAWAGADYRGPTGATWVIQTLNATWQVTGVQLEKGSTATSFDYRPYGTELQLCQRYFQSFSYTGGTIIATGTTFSTSAGSIPFNFYFPMRTTPSTITVPTVGNLTGQWTVLSPAGGFPGTYGTIGSDAASPNNLRLNFSGFTGVFASTGQAAFLYASGGTVVVTVSAEL